LLRAAFLPDGEQDHQQPSFKTPPVAPGSLPDSRTRVSALRYVDSGPRAIVSLDRVGLGRVATVVPEPEFAERDEYAPNDVAVVEVEGVWRASKSSREADVERS
jgi:hypothetical protein